MAVVVDRDAHGVWAALECDREGCPRHVSARPRDGDIFDLADIVATVCEWGRDEGWVFAGYAWCPDHVPQRLERPMRRSRWRGLGSEPVKA